MKKSVKHSHLSARTVTVVDKKKVMVWYHVQSSAYYCDQSLLKGILVLWVIEQHLQVGELLLGSWPCFCGFNIWVEKKLSRNDLSIGCKP